MLHFLLAAPLDGKTSLLGFDIRLKDHKTGKIARKWDTCVKLLLEQEGS
jgi:hypothetical protein